MCRLSSAPIDGAVSFSGETLATRPVSSTWTAKTRSRKRARSGLRFEPGDQVGWRHAGLVGLDELTPRPSVSAHRRPRRSRPPGWWRCRHQWRWWRRRRWCQLCRPKLALRLGLVVGCRARLRPAQRCP